MRCNERVQDGHVPGHVPRSVALPTVVAVAVAVAPVVCHRKVHLSGVDLVWSPLSRPQLLLVLVYCLQLEGREGEVDEVTLNPNNSWWDY